MQQAYSGYVFGCFQLDSVERRLARDGVAVPLTPKAFDTLLVLVQNSGHVLSKDELMRAVWPDGFVEEINLAYNISILRKALTDGQPGGKYIETVPKVGYRFAAPVSEHHTGHSTHPTNISARLTRFIGRERELTEIAPSVIEHRLVTLVGTAGMGKTRLALEVGDILFDRFPNGVWLVELAPLADGALVAQTVAAVFGLQEQPSQTAIDALTTFIAEKQMLLIFDNCEHVIEASAQLVEALLRACPNLHILVTSREALRVPGEMMWHVPPLNMPDPTNLPELERAASYDAVELFVNHAALAQPGFSLTQDNLATVARICHQLDGMPLTIEMAAAQIAFLGLAGVAVGLDDRLGLLTNGSRTAVRHHQTLRATLDWSYNLLMEPERALLARLSVFAGGWTAQAAQVVCESTHHELLQLARHSLVMTYVNEHDGEPRYRFLETIRDYAGERLRERGEREVTLDRHLTYFLAMAEEPVEFAGPRVNPWVRRVDVDYDNMRAAFARAMLQPDEGEAALRFANAMTTYSYHRGHLMEIGAWANQAWSRAEKAPTYARARGLLAKASYYLLTGDKFRGVQLCGQALPLLRQTDDRVNLAGCLEMLANNSFDDRVQAYAEEALPLFRELGSRDGEGRIMRALGTVALRAGDHARAAQLLAQAIELAPWDATVCYKHLYDADPKRALELCAQNYARLSPSDAPDQAVEMLVAYGIMLVSEGNYAGARRMLEQSIRAWEQVDAGRPFDLAPLTLPLTLDIFELSPSRLGAGVCGSFSFVLLGFIEHVLGRLDYANARLDQGHAFASEAGMMWLQVSADFLKTSLKIAEGYLDVDMQEVVTYVRRFSQLNQPLSTVCALVQIASLAGCRGDMIQACTLLGAAEALIPKLLDIMAYYIFCIPSFWLRRAQNTIIDPTLAAARTALGDAVFEAAYAEGQHMTLDEAVALALNSAPNG